MSQERVFQEPAFYRSELFQPVYRPFDGERWRLDIAPLSTSRGYWSEALFVRGMAVLTRKEPAGRETWMSMTPLEIESQEIGCKLARGHTIVMGLGMGWAAAATATSPEVTMVTVVERDPEVIDMVREQGVFAQLPPADSEKICVVWADALDYRSEIPADTLLADIWRPLNGDERVEEVRRMAKNTGARKVYFWGQEMTIARRVRRLGKNLDAATVAEIVASLDLPLLGMELDDYPELIGKAAAQWLKDPEESPAG